MFPSTLCRKIIFRRGANYRVKEESITLPDMDFGTRPMIGDFDRFFPVETETADESREMVLVFERNGVKSPKKRVFGHF